MFTYRAVMALVVVALGGGVAQPAYAEARVRVELRLAGTTPACMLSVTTYGAPRGATIVLQRRAAKRWVALGRYVVSPIDERLALGATPLRARGCARS